MLGLREPAPGTPVASAPTTPLQTWSKQTLDPDRPRLPPNPRIVGLKDAGMSGFYRVATSELFEGIPIGKDDVVVDVGCGEGAALGFCADRGAAIMAVDVHQGTLDSARELLKDKPARSQEFFLGAAEDLPIEAETATRVLCMEVLEHVADPQASLRELYRIGQPGALYLITVPDARGEELTKLLGPENYFEPPNHIRIISRDEIEEWVTGAGLEILAHRFYGFFWVLWYNLFWRREVDIDAPTDPVLSHWTMAWKALLDSEGGAEIKDKFDEFMPKSQIIVARRPDHPA